MIKKFLLLPAFAMVASAWQLSAQTAWYYQWGLLPEKTIDYFIGECSGERTYNHIIELSEYNRQRDSEEFADILFESQYVTAKLKEYGLSEINIERFGKTQVWRGISGSLWEVSPGREKLADFIDLPFHLIPGSPVTDTEGELVFIGDAYNGELDKVDLTGKIVLTSARPSSIMNAMLQKGVTGIVSYYSPRPLEDPLMIPDMKGGSLTRGSLSKIFAFSISPRDGIVLSGRLRSGEKITVNATVRFRTEEVDIQVPTCTIQGTDPAAGEIIVSAHLFEGYGNQGANDNISGSATILESARVISQLVKDGIITRPKRTIRFIWVPEFSGTIPWVRAHKDLMKKTICNLNLDMVGLSLSRYKSYYVLHRTTYGNAHYLNDVVENYFRYVGETNQMNSVISGSRFFKRIVAPTGTDDPFYYQVESSSGGSDHEVFNDWGVQVPGIMMITWPDPFYHTSQDRADKCDPTQLKRAVFINSISAYTIASAGEDEAINISGEVYGNSIRRIGYQVSKAFDEINKTGADNLVAVLRRSISNLKGISTGEQMTMNSIIELDPGSERLRGLVNAKIVSLSAFTESVISSLTSTAEMRASDFGMARITLTQTNEERRAANMIPEISSDPRELGYEGYSEKISGLSEAVRNKYNITGLPDPSEALACINGKNSVLDIKNLLDSQNNRETNLEGLINYFRLVSETGLIKF